MFSLFYVANGLCVFGPHMRALGAQINAFCAYARDASFHFFKNPKNMAWARVRARLGPGSAWARVRARLGPGLDWLGLVYVENSLGVFGPFMRDLGAKISGFC